MTKQEILKPLVIDALADDYIRQHWPYLHNQADVHVLFLFMDGVGIGRGDDEHNPFLADPDSMFYPIQKGELTLPWEGRVAVTDPLLHVPGLPQSGTGQTALFAGVDGARVLERHVPGLPTFTLKRILARHSIFRRMVDAGRKPALANGYSDLFFSGKRRHHSASTMAYFAGGLPFRSFRDVRASRAVFMDITNRMGRKFGMDIPLRGYAEAAAILKELVEQNEFTMFEYFLTDKAGHTAKPGLARRSIQHWENFLRALLQTIDLERVQVIVSSDHGNVEDLSQKRHTRNKVPTLLWGPQSHELAQGITDLVSVHRAACRVLDLPFPEAMDRAEEA